MPKLILTALGMVALFGGGLLFVEGRRRWLIAGIFGAIAVLCLAIGKGTPWVLLALLAGGGLLYFLSYLSRETPARPRKDP